jgi:hypothetical protein
MNTTIETTAAKFQPKEVKIGDYFLKFGNNGGRDKNKPTLQYGKILTTGKNKGSKKTIWAYWYANIEQRDAKAIQTYTNVKANLESEAKQKAENKKRNADFDVKTLVGKIFYSSWGYDQTNVDFYQVIGTTNKMVIIREISHETVEGSEGMMCDRVKPSANEFIGNESKHLVKVTERNIYICNGRHSLTEYDNGDRGTYRSWYA